MLRVIYWVLIVLGLYNAVWLLGAMMRGDWLVCVAGGTMSTACLLTAALIGDDVDGT